MAVGKVVSLRSRQRVGLDHPKTWHYGWTSASFERIGGSEKKVEGRITGRVTDGL